MVTQLSKLLIQGEIDENTTVYIDAAQRKEEVSCRVERNGGLVNAATGHSQISLSRSPTLPSIMMPRGL